MGVHHDHGDFHGGRDGWTHDAVGAGEVALAGVEGSVGKVGRRGVGGDGGSVGVEGAEPNGVDIVGKPASVGTGGVARGVGEEVVVEPCAVGGVEACRIGGVGLVQVEAAEHGTRRGDAVVGLVDPAHEVADDGHGAACAFLVGHLPEGGMGVLITCSDLVCYQELGAEPGDGAVGVGVLGDTPDEAWRMGADALEIAGYPLQRDAAGGIGFAAGTGLGNGSLDAAVGAGKDREQNGKHGHGHQHFNQTETAFFTHSGRASQGPNWFCHRLGAACRI